MRNANGRTGFALVELALTTLMVLAIAALVILLAGEQRRSGRLGEDLGKLRRIGALTGQYGADHADRFWTFSWRKGDALSQYPDLNNASTDMQAGANQAVDILRRHGRPDMPLVTGWFAHLTYSHLVLADGGYSSVPEPLLISSMDTNRLLWSRDPAGFDAGVYQPAPPMGGSSRRWAYSASFQLDTSYYDRSGLPNRVTQGGAHRFYLVPGNHTFVAVTLNEVAFPSARVHLHDGNARHFGPAQPFATHEEARLPLLMADGSVVVRAAAESNPGWNPNLPSSATPTSFTYQPDPWEPPAVSGTPQDLVTGRFRWTRGLWTGRDFNGPEACTGQPGCP